jgi:tetratricopeptide (TPR) repeat protein
MVDCNEAIKLDRNDSRILDSRAFVYLKLGQLDKSIADYDAALKIDPELGDSLYGRGVAKKRKGDSVGGADIVAAKAIRANIVEEYKKYGIN